MWTPETRLDRGAEVIVVGSGLSGLAVASELVAASVRDVLVLEAGTYDRAQPNPSLHTWPGRPAWVTVTPPHYLAPGHTPDPRSSANPLSSQWRGVGGRSLDWHGVVLRIEDYALGDTCWPQVTRDKLLGCHGHVGMYEQVEDELARWRVATPEWRAGAQRQDEADDALVQLLTTAAGLTARPVPQAVRYSAAAGVPRRVYTPLDRFLEQSGPSGKTPRIASGLSAVAVLTTRGAASGVLVYNSVLGRCTELHSSTVVLAAGTIENTRLVAQLRPDRQPARYDGLNDHLTQGFVAPIRVDSVPHALRSGAFVLLARDAERRCNVFARLHGGPAAAGMMLLDVWALGEQIRSPASHVTVTPPPGSAHGPWSTAVAASLSDDDVRVLSGERDLLASVWARLAGTFGTKPVPLHFADFLTAPRPFHIVRDEALSSRLPLPLTYAWPLGAGDHEGGTLPLGSLLDSAGTVSEADGVFVTGPATFPRSGAANPSLTTLALARLTARSVCARRV